MFIQIIVFLPDQMGQQSKPKKLYMKIKKKTLVADVDIRNRN